MAAATVHHWPDPIAGLLELQRVAPHEQCALSRPSSRRWAERNSALIEAETADVGLRLVVA